MVNMSLSSYERAQGLPDASVIGNVIPHTWYKHIKTDSGKSDIISITLLSEVFYLYRLSSQQINSYHNQTKIQNYCEDGVQLGYKHFEDKFGFTKDQVRRSLVRLEGMGLIRRDIRNTSSSRTYFNNVMFLHLNVEAIKCITSFSMQISPNTIQKPEYTETKNTKVYNFLHKNDKFATTSLQICKDIIETEKQKKKYRSEHTTSDFSNYKWLQNTSLDKNPTELSTKTPALERTTTECSRKPIGSFYPLTEEDAVILRKNSGRDFKLDFINKLLLKLTKQYPGHGFFKKSILLSYMTETLEKEKSNPETVNNESFQFKPKLGSDEYNKQNIERYLDAIEQSLETNISTQIKRKIIGMSAGDSKYAYHLITNCHFPYLVQDYKTHEYKIKISTDITEDQKSVIDKAVKNILGQAVNVSFYKEKNPISNSHDAIETATSSSPIWGRTREILRKYCGNAIDNSWFSKLDMEVKQDKSQIIIKSPTSFIRDWVKREYESKIEKAISELSKEISELKYYEGAIFGRNVHIEWVIE